jgi:hypothetical protein
VKMLKKMFTSKPKSQEYNEFEKKIDNFKKQLKYSLFRYGSKFDINAEYKIVLNEYLKAKSFLSLAESQKAEEKMKKLESIYELYGLTDSDVTSFVEKNEKLSCGRVDGEDSSKYQAFSKRYSQPLVGKPGTSTNTKTTQNTRSSLGYHNSELPRVHSNPCENLHETGGSKKVVESIQFGHDRDLSTEYNVRRQNNWEGKGKVNKIDTNIERDKYFEVNETKDSNREKPKDEETLRCFHCGEPSSTYEKKSRSKSYNTTQYTTNVKHDDESNESERSLSVSGRKTGTTERGTVMESSTETDRKDEPKAESTQNVRYRPHQSQRWDQLPEKMETTEPPSYDKYTEKMDTIETPSNMNRPEGDSATPYSLIPSGSADFNKSGEYTQFRPSSSERERQKQNTNAAERIKQSTTQMNRKREPEPESREVRGYQGNRGADFGKRSSGRMETTIKHASVTDLENNMFKQNSQRAEQNVSGYNKDRDEASKREYWEEKDQRTYQDATVLRSGTQKSRPDEVELEENYCTSFQKQSSGQDARKVDRPHYSHRQERTATPNQGRWIGNYKQIEESRPGTSRQKQSEEIVQQRNMLNTVEDKERTIVSAERGASTGQLARSVDNKFQTPSSKENYSVATEASAYWDTNRAQVSRGRARQGKQQTKGEISYPHGGGGYTQRAGYWPSEQHKYENHHQPPTRQQNERTQYETKASCDLAVEAEDVDENPLEILDVHQFFRDDFDLKTLDDVDHPTRIKMIHELATNFEDPIRNFTQPKHSLEYFILDEKLMRFIENLDRIKSQDEAVTLTKVKVIEYIKELHNILDKRALDD